MRMTLRIIGLAAVTVSLLGLAVIMETPRSDASTLFAADGNDNKRRGRGSDDQNRNGNGNSNRSNSNSAGNSNSNSNGGSTGISRDRAREIALEHVAGEIVKEEIKNRKGRRVFEFKIRKADGALFEVKIDANDGSLVEIERK